MIETPYVAYGLALRSSFALPGMEPTGEQGLPVLELELVSPAQLALAWSGPDGPPAWRGRLGDGSDLEISTAAPEICCSPTASALASAWMPASARSWTAPRFDPGLDWQRTLLIGKVHPEHQRDARV
jgi:hypothetical protein